MSRQIAGCPQKVKKLVHEQVDRAAATTAAVFMLGRVQTSCHAHSFEMAHIYYEIVLDSTKAEHATGRRKFSHACCAAAHAEWMARVHCYHGGVGFWRVPDRLACDVMAVQSVRGSMHCRAEAVMRPRRVDVRPTNCSYTMNMACKGQPRSFAALWAQLLPSASESTLSVKHSVHDTAER
jgi:hypothetical protein